MTGMYSATSESEIMTAEAIVSCGAKSTRIYPTVVFRETGLERLVESGEFVPLTLEESIERTFEVYKIFKEAGIKILRIGLCSSDGVRSDDAISVYDEAMGERILSRDRRDLLDGYIQTLDFKAGDLVEIPVLKRDISASIGFKRENKIYLENKYGIKLKFKGMS